ncbi:30S ribosomal protein 3, chloroplastic [Lactuca sativa]|uniref:30S ribosomal protein 3, chloroplastic n=1 Tax=Lactuca sativa TaxID=4236 RepID=UPI000CD8EFB6|nr:30S ribosomal protein 3, chloroplastic [Lactuca sativa]
MGLSFDQNDQILCNNVFDDDVVIWEIEIEDRIMQTSGVVLRTPIEEDEYTTTTVATKKGYERYHLPMAKPRLVLKFIWMEKNIGLALDQVIPGYESIPLSPYYFWPREDAWEELKVMLECKPWISQKQVIVILTQATKIINLL